MHAKPSGAKPPSVDAASGLPSRFGFLLLDNFTLISLSAAIEPLRMANRLLGSEFYRWQLISATGGPVRASDGVELNVDFSIQNESRVEGLDAIIVCGGVRVEQNCRDSELKFLRMAARRGAGVGALCTGSFALAKAGLLDGYECSIHWENAATLSEGFPRVHVSSNVFSIDRNRFTSSGGTAPIDMMLHFVARQHGQKLVAAVAEQFIYDKIRDTADKQRVPLRHLVGHHSNKLTTAVELMEANLKEPLSQEELADYVGLSRRQLQRLFGKYLGCAPSRYYLQLRLRRARELLRQSGLSVLEISSVCGFVSTSHFSKSYKEFFGYSPSHERRQM